MRMMRLWTTRPHLTSGVVVGVVAWVVLALMPDLRWSTRAILAWDTGCLAFIGGMMFHMANKRADHLRAKAAAQDEGQGLILGIVLLSSVASLATVAVELGLAKDADGLEKTVRISLAAATVAASWFVVQLIFALHYANMYYTAGREGGLAFPHDQHCGEPPEPDYWDFVHFAVVIGAAAQTADIAFTSKSMRRMGTVHSLIAFVFNTVVLALSINLLASLV
jgi:uncharacterized membrane protein